MGWADISTGVAALAAVTPASVTTAIVTAQVRRTSTDVTDLTAARRAVAGAASTQPLRVSHSAHPSTALHHFLQQEHGLLLQVDTELARRSGEVEHEPLDLAVVVGHVLGANP